MNPRRPDELRPIEITRRFTNTAAGSVLWKQGETIILVTASVAREVPPWFGPRQLGGWLTAEYTMLPGSTPQRKPWPRIGHTDSRGTEIQRLIGRVLRAAIDLSKIGPHTIHLDCHVLQADGGTRTASICAGFVALYDAVASLPKTLVPADASQPTPTELAYDPARAVLDPVVAVSVGVIDGQMHLDLDYKLDSRASVDMNIACTAAGKYVEIQGAGENGGTFDHEQLLGLLALGRSGCDAIVKRIRAELSWRLFQGDRTFGASKRPD